MDIFSAPPNVHHWRPLIPGSIQHTIGSPRASSSVRMDKFSHAIENLSVSEVAEWPKSVHQLTLEPFAISVEDSDEPAKRARRDVRLMNGNAWFAWR